MAIDVNKVRQENGILPSQSTPPQRVEAQPLTSRPIDMTGRGSQAPIPADGKQPIPLTNGNNEQPDEGLDIEDAAIEEVPSEQPQEIEEKATYTVKKGDNLWNVAKEQLIASGNSHPTNSDIMKAMKDIAQTNGCRDVIECKNKFFSKIGSELDLSGLFGNPKSSNTQAASNNKSEGTNTQTAKKTTQETNNQSQLEALAKKTGIDGDIDEIVRTIRSKEVSSQQLTDAEKAFIDAFNNTHKQEASKFTAEEQKIIKVTQEVMASGILKKSPEEQVLMLAKQYAAGNENFKNLSPEEQKQYLAKTAGAIATLAKTDKYDNYPEGIQKLATGMRAIVVVGVAKDSGYTLEQLQAMSADKREGILRNAENTAINIALDIITKSIKPEELQGKSGKEKTNLILDKALEIINPEYKNKSADAQKADKNEIISFIAEKAGFHFGNIDGVPDAVFSSINAHIIGIMEYAKEKGLNPLEAVEGFNGLSRQEQCTIQIKALEEQPPTEENKITLNKLRTEWKIYRSIGLDEEKEPTIGKISDCITEMLKNPEKYGLTEDEKNYLKIINMSISRQMGPKGEHRDEEFGGTFITQEDLAKIQGYKDFEQSIICGPLGDANSDNILSEKMLNELKSLIGGREKGSLADFDFHDILIIRNTLAKENGIPLDKIDKAIEMCIGSKAYSRMMTFMTKPEELNEAFKYGLNINKMDVVETTVREVAGWKGEISSIKSLQTYGITLQDNNNLTTALFTGIHQYQGKENAVEVASFLANSDQVSNANKSSIARISVATAPDDATKLYMGRELSSRTDNPYALEGLAAASNTIQDTSMRNQYNGYVDNAVSRVEASGKYSSEEMSQIKNNIQQARETGMTQSEAKAAQNTQQEVKTSTQKSQQEQKAQLQAEHEALVVKKQKVLEYIKETIAKTFAPTKLSTSASAESAKEAAKKQQAAMQAITKEIEAVNKAKTVQEAQKAKEALLKRIEEFQAEVRRSQEEYSKKISEQDAVNAFITDTEIIEETKDEAVAVAADTEVQAADGANAQVAPTGISPETAKELKEAYHSGGITALYEKAATLVGAKAQERLLNYISHTSSSTLHSFASAHSNNKNVLMTLFKNSKDPYIMQLLIQNGYASEILNSGAISVKDFIAHASPATVANWLTDLQKTGATYTLKEAFNHIDNVPEQVTPGMTPGSDEWLRAQNKKMAQASENETIEIAKSSPALSGYEAFEDDGQIAFNSPIVSNWKRQGRNRKITPFHMIG